MYKALSIIFLCILLTSKGYCQFPEEGDQEAGFVSIFDGKTLDGWTGDPVYWRVENGIMIGEITPETIVKENTFVIYDTPIEGDFELKVSYRVSAEGNSGINYRSERIEGKPFALRGYQSDIDGKNKWTGQNYEEKARKFLALRGQIARVEKGGKPNVIGYTGDKEKLAADIKPNEWQECYLIIRNNVLIHMVNNQIMSMVIDDDEENRKFGGLIGVQVHVGPPMTIEYKDFRIKKIKH
ncbi:MAG: DUF1080 domain-containing protein [Cyclobacteriaceae bacterium]